MPAVMAALVVLLCGAMPALAEDSKFLWQRLAPQDLVRFQNYARRVVNGDDARPDDVLKLWKQGQIPLIEYGIDLGDGDRSGAMPGLIWTVGELKDGSDGQLDRPLTIDLDYRWQAAKSVPPIDAASPSIDVYVADGALPDLAKVEVLHEDGLQREVVRRGNGCQIARWSRCGEIVKVAGTVRIGADQGAPVYDSTYGGPRTEGLTAKGLEALCASRIIAFGLGLNFVSASFTGQRDESLMMEGASRQFAFPYPFTDQPLIELLYRSDLKPGSPKAKAIALIDGLKAGQ